MVTHPAGLKSSEVSSCDSSPLMCTINRSNLINIYSGLLTTLYCLRVVYVVVGSGIQVFRFRSFSKFCATMQEL